MALNSSWFVLMMPINLVELYILQRNITEALVVASNENELEVNADNTKHTDIFGDEDVGQSDSIKINNSSLKMWKGSKIWKQSSQIKILLKKKLRSE
jgi:hypothetical protein